MAKDYRVSLENYSGPMDLLLYLIRREEVDVHDIPLAKVIDQYLQYVELLQEPLVHVTWTSLKPAAEGATSAPPLQTAPAAMKVSSVLQEPAEHMPLLDRLFTQEEVQPSQSDWVQLSSSSTQAPREQLRQPVQVDTPPHAASAHGRCWLPLMQNTEPVAVSAPVPSWTQDVAVAWHRLTPERSGSQFLDAHS